MSCYFVGRWWAWDRAGLAVRVACGAPAERTALTAAELAHLAGRSLAPERRDAWIRGRALAHRALGLPDSVLATAAGQPRVAGGAWRIGFSHDGPWTALIACRHAVAAGVAVDVVACEPARAARALARVRVRGAAAVDPRAVWSALECAVKLRGRHIACLLGRPVEVSTAPSGALVVAGLGARLAVQIARLPSATIAWSDGSQG